jgi:filamentous hemagglutinin family protein
MRGGRRAAVGASPGRSGRVARRASGAAALLLAAAAPGAAQVDAPVYFDGSLGFEGSAYSLPDVDGTGVEYQIDYCPSCGAVTHPFGSQGRLVDSSLFHSLRDIDVPLDDAARFAISEPNVAVDYVFARITSGKETKFFGDLRSDLGADIYLFNPFGMVFGAGSQIDVNGTFYVSTADELRFDDGKTFEARAGGLVPMIEVGAPSSFGFLVDDEPPARILFDAANGLLSNEPGASLTAVAGRIEIDDGTGSSATIVSNGGQIKLAAVPAGTDVPVDVESLDVDTLPSDAAAVHMAQNSSVSVSGTSPSGPARIVIRAGRFETVQPSVTSTSASLRARNTGADTTDPAAIDVEVAGTISLDAGVIESVNGGTPGGNIRLVGETIELFGEANVDARIASVFANAPGSDIHVEATTVDVRDGSTIRTRDDANGITWGKVGDITVLADQVNVSGSGSAISTRSRGTGNGATIRVEATDVTLDDAAQISANRLKSAFASNVPDDGGGIEILAENLSVLDRAEINSATSTDIAGASIQIGTAEDPVTNLSVVDGAIGSLTTAEGRGGDVDVHADSIVLNRTLETADVNPQISALTTRNDAGGGGDGPGGNLTIRAGTVQLDNGSQLRATTQGDENAPGGTLTVEVEGTLTASGSFTPPPSDGDPNPDSIPSGIFAKSELSPTAPGTPTTGQGGQLLITAQHVVLGAGAEFSAAADSEGPAGNLDLVAETVLVEGDPETNATSTISVRGTTGSGGDLTITTDLLQAYNQGIVTASTSGTGRSGNLNVIAREVDIAGEGSGVFAQSNFENVGAGRAGAVSLAPPEGEQLTLRVRDGALLSVKSVQNAAGAIEIKNAALIEVTNGGEISASVGNVLLQGGEDPGDLASDIRIVDANTVRMNQGTMTAETIGNGVGGTIGIDATSVELIDSTMTAQTRASGAGGSIDIDAVDVQMTGGTMTAETSATGQGGFIDLAAETVGLSGAEITARSTGDAPASGNAGEISVRAAGSFRMAGSEISTEAQEAAAGDITLSGGQTAEITEQSLVSSLANGAGDAGDIFVVDTQTVSISDQSVVTAETNGAGTGGTIAFQNVGDVFLSDESSITTKSTAEAGGGPAGDIIIAAQGTFQAAHSAITTTAENAGGGRISIQGGELVYLFESLVETTVNGADDVAGADAGDIDIPLRGDEAGEPFQLAAAAAAAEAGGGLDPALPKFVVINRSTIRANAVATDAGNITIAGDDVLISSDSVIEATSQTGVSGQIQISSPDADVVGQITPLPSSFVDPSDRLLPPCIARTERTGSFVVRNRAAIPPSPDAPLSPSPGGALPRIDSVSCPEIEENP